MHVFSGGCGHAECVGSTGEFKSMRRRRMSGSIRTVEESMYLLGNVLLIRNYNLSVLASRQLETQINKSSLLWISQI